MAEPVIQLRGVGKAVPGLPHLLSDVSLSVERGSSVAIMGRSGSGKSTMLSVLGLLDPDFAGEYLLNGQRVDRLSSRACDRLRGTEIGFVFQRFALFAHLSALENVMVPLRHRGGSTERAMRHRAHAALDSVDMGHAARRRPRHLSGGEQQRVAIARALINDPALILADEPTGSLDADTGRTIVSLLLGRVAEQGAALVVVTHEHDVAAEMDDLLRLTRGTLAPGSEVPAPAADHRPPALAEAGA
ncbi:ABC transporter ATP-binding protein [Galbitalea soli]|uniref:ABC transporter ATP-binding protein n=1 Tax=Galbitalea soli TaxID=1268042 RepID=A0A7C9TSY5_9MICO|nr:ABC transporter ATP-binding protein [Galbitalea soli]NEM92495.1 ABC transporter ATP-binding protein [Galbitalea soli]NYJ29532.1 putative ABC transport system ATP-binding protein [Galbitalea soli]